VPISYEAVCRALGLSPPASRAGIEIRGASVDSRSITPGQLFVCIPGKRADGHDFAANAVAAGAAAVLAQRRPDNFPADAPLLLVPDSIAALGKIAALRRETTKARVIGVTGTAGKTTVKEMLARILAERGPTAKNFKNLNNRIGLPLSILNAEGTEDFWVMEAGISLPGDMDELGSVLRPDLALILNAGAGHTEGLGSPEDVARHKAGLLRRLAPGGTGLASADYPALARECRNVRGDVRFFSAEDGKADYRASYRGKSRSGRGLYRLWLDGVLLDVETPFHGRYGAENAVAAAAAARLSGLAPEEIRAGLARAEMPQQRFACRPCGSWLLIDDSYNANPLSCRRMLEAAAETAQGRPLICVMGEMGELGGTAEEEHERLGRRLAEALPEIVFWKGEYGGAVRNGLECGHFQGIFIELTAPPEDFPARLREMNPAAGVVFFKGSRSNRMEDLVRIFEEWEASRAV
jgi:UDP-N-acetylmuramoyl-tripeptide--D-alanyl-D-alanine ligase